MTLGAERQLLVGQEEDVLASFHESGAPGVLFEDDGETGYFYALESAETLKVLDALHIYNVADVTDGHIASTCQIVWNDEQTAAVLVINGYCHALFDFAQQTGFCRNAFPPKTAGSAENRLLDDELLMRYFPSENQ